MVTRVREGRLNDEPIDATQRAEPVWRGACVHVSVVEPFEREVDPKDGGR
jgi:hypothetical protein